MIDCGTCTAPETCGGGGVHFQCGGGVGPNPGQCNPKTCADLGVQCGVVADGCGGVTAACGSCPAGTTCGGGGTPNVCEGPPCTGLCNQVNACTGLPKTTITGTVTAPGHDDVVTFGQPDPIYGALVYVPNGVVQPFTQGVSCDSCSSLTTGDPLISVTTGVDGRFTLTDAPCGANVPVVMQLGRWRRQITIPNVNCCQTNALTNAQTHLPRNKSEGDIPLMAFSTGDVDTLHCVMRKIGIDDAEFTNPAGNGRIRFYKDNGAVVNGTTPNASSLFTSFVELARYDMALFECVGARQPKTLQDQQHLVDYADAGGRIFATHYSYVWLTNSTGTAGTSTAPNPFFRTADWLVDQGAADTGVVGTVDTNLQSDPATQTRRVAFRDWLKLVGASTTLGQIPVNVARHDFRSVTTTVGTAGNTPAQLWLSATTVPPPPPLPQKGIPFNAPLHYTFDTPIRYAPDPKPTTQCGRVLYSDFHVSDAKSGGKTFPAECANGKMTPQEKTLEFMLFDLASCVGPPPVAQCTPKTCAQLGSDCGLSGDGCDDGVVLDCGTCATNQVCGVGAGGGNVCGANPCVPQTCADVMAQCGIIGDGCGATVDCGPCMNGQVCGAGGTPNVCASIVVTHN